MSNCTDLADWPGGWKWRKASQRMRFDTFSWALKRVSQPGKDVQWHKAQNRLTNQRLARRRLWITGHKRKLELEKHRHAYREQQGHKWEEMGLCNQNYSAWRGSKMLEQPHTKISRSFQLIWENDSFSLITQMWKHHGGCGHVAKGCLTKQLVYFFSFSPQMETNLRLSWALGAAQKGKYSLLGGFSLLSPVNFRGASGAREALEILHKYSDTVLVLLSGCDGCDWIICHTACCPSCIPQVTDLSTRKTNPQHWS